MATSVVRPLDATGAAGAARPAAMPVRCARRRHGWTGCAGSRRSGGRRRRLPSAACDCPQLLCALTTIP